MKISKCLISYKVFSPLQLLNFLSFYNKNEKLYFKAIIFMDESLFNSIDKSYIELCYQLKVEIQLKKFNALSLKKNVYDVVFVSRVNAYFWPQYYKNKSIRFDKIIIIDDGISNYCNNLHVIKASLREGGLGGLIRFLITLNLNKILYSFNKNKIIEYSIFNKKNLQVNEDYKKSFISILKLINRKDRRFENGVVFCSQPLVELGITTEKKYIEEIISIRSKIEEMGYKLYVKKHPRENLVDYGKYSISMIDFDGIVEELFLNDSFYAVISNCSTSSILIPALFNTKSYIYDTKIIKNSGFLINQLFNKYCNNLDQLMLERE